MVLLFMGSCAGRVQWPQSWSRYYKTLPQKKLPVSMTPLAFRRAVLSWYGRHGRRDLPWQRNPSAYRVWVSEIMLQQTRVATVIPYFARFMRVFPSLRKLAVASADEVMHCWSGLGYYSRARNLHRTARLLCREYGGRFPAEAAQLAALPGIGRSTAGAIAAAAFGRRAAILDGNVRRVLARFYAVDDEGAALERQLWEHAQRCTPQQRAADYNQAMMDLGASICTRSSPDCGRCPLRRGCRAFFEGCPQAYPPPRRRKALPVRRRRAWLVETPAGEFLLERRPPSGIWGGLWSFPETAARSAPPAVCRRLLAECAGEEETLPVIRHDFSHFRLLLQPVHLRLKCAARTIAEEQGRLWYNPACPPRLGMAAPVARLLEQLRQPRAPRRRRSS